MLSKENAEKLVMTGLYRHEPDKRYRGSLFWDDLYHCFNWTFKVGHRESDDSWYMVDTYFGNRYIELTDENFDEFELLFDVNEVCRHSGENIHEYDDKDWWHVAVDSGGISHKKFFVRKGATKSKEKVLSRIEDEIHYLERQIERKKADYQRVQNDEVDLDWV